MHHQIETFASRNQQRISALNVADRISALEIKLILLPMYGSVAIAKRPPLLATVRLEPREAA